MSVDPTMAWAILIAAAVFLYVVMDGFDLGIGILFLAERDRDDRGVMINAIAPVWDGNETWLVLGGGGLLAAFPLAYAVILPAIYMPVTLMLLALVFRGVAFEMRFRSETDRARALWDRAFAFGSIGAAACQGTALGAIVQGIPVANRSYAGGWWDWLSPFSVLTGLALVCGYALLGACWMIWKTEGPLQERARQYARWLCIATVGFIAVVSLVMLALSPPFRERWLSYPNVFLVSPVPLLVGLLTWRFLAAIAEGREVLPFMAALGLFLLSYIGLAISLYPMIVPPSISIWDAATHPSSQRFLLVGALVLVPVILVYTGYVYWIFRGKVTHGAGYH